MHKLIPLITVIAALLIIPARADTRPDHVTKAKILKAFSADKVEIEYLSGGSGETTLVFIHGGYADKGYWRNQVNVFSKKYRVIALDLAGHGESGRNRKIYNMKSFAGDVLAVIEKEKVNSVVLIGNSLGGPVALETARLIPGKVIGIVAVDTFNDFQAKPPDNRFKRLAQSMRSNFSGTMGSLAKSLFHGGDKHRLYSELTKKMLGFPPAIAASVIESFEGYDLLQTVKNVSQPIRCISGDLYPMQLEKNRQVYPDFNAVIMPKTGHYPMLERPEAFNRHLKRILSEFTKSSHCPQP